LLSEVQPYCYFDTSVPYTRNLIATDHETYTLLVLCWSPRTTNCSGSSPIHNHPGDGCYMRVVSGRVTERIYQERHSCLNEKHHTLTMTPKNSNTTTVLECIATRHYTKSHVTYINDEIGYHSIGCSPNDDEDEDDVRQNVFAGAITLHLYCPPIPQCQIFVPSPKTDHITNSNTALTNDGVQQHYHTSDSGPMYHHTEYGQWNK
jgi:cysteine dioxygenase